MKCVVTGGAGFIGSHLAHALCDLGHDVRVVDDLSTGSLENLAWRRSGHCLEFIETDIADSVAIEGILRGSDWIFHLAAQPSVALSMSDPWRTHRINLDATLHLLVGA